MWRRGILLAGGVDALEPCGDKEASCTPPKRAHVQEEDTEDGVHLSGLNSGLPARATDQVGPYQSGLEISQPRLFD